MARRAAPLADQPVRDADDVAPEEYEPPVLFGMFFPEDLVTLAADLEQIRKRLCLYGPAAQTCDCKYISGGTVGQGERSGCCEVRAASRLIGSSEAKMVTQLQKENARLRRALANVERAVAYAARGEHNDGPEIATFGMGIEESGLMPRQSDGSACAKPLADASDP